jgi:hypothetical protein
VASDKSFFTKLSLQKKILLVTFSFLFSAVLVTAVLMERPVQNNEQFKDVFNAKLPVAYSSLSESKTSRLRAEVKGSIYENGSNMTVFGACYDGSNYLLPAATTSFTAWYPDGSFMTGPNASMDKIYADYDHPTGNSTNNPNGTGRWKIHVTMGDTIGTYLTELRCEYQGDTAIAFGEWQNPEWVKRIADTQTTVNEIGNNTNTLLLNLSQYQNATQANFNSIISSLNNLTNSTSAQNTQYAEAAIADLNLNRWVVDSHNPFYVLNSNTHNWAAVDMISQDAAAAASFDGYMGIWDGNSWVEYQQNAQFRGVSILPATTPYVWAVGTDNASNPVISINGANLTTPSNVTGTALNDVKLFQAPNNPAQMYYASLLSDDGTVWLSNDAGATYAQIGTVASDTVGRLSVVTDNHGTSPLPNGYVLAAAQGNTVLIYTTSANYYTLPAGCYAKDISLFSKTLGYVAVKCTSDARVYKYDGAALSLEYTITDPFVAPTGIKVLSPNNIWVTTLDPSTFFKFDGLKWQYSNLGWSSLVSVVISFGNSTSQGITDLAMSDTRHGYAVGVDGLILLYKSDQPEFIQNNTAVLNAIQANFTELAQIIANLNISSNFTGNFTFNVTTNNSEVLAAIAQLNSTIYQFNSQIDGNFTQIQFNFTQLQNLITSINTTSSNNTEVLAFLTFFNQSVSADIAQLNSLVQNMNISVQNIQNTTNLILGNVTYTQLYLETTIYPVMNATYQNTLAILVQLGILEGKINETIQLQQNTLNIVNQTSQDVTELVNRSRMMRAWSTT